MWIGTFPPKPKPCHVKEEGRGTRTTHLASQAGDLQKARKENGEVL